jgi:uncharacterized phiE125 gp8 family phage protein
MTPILIAPPAVEPIALADAKAWLRIENTAEDELVGTLIASARLVVENLTRRFMVAQTWRLVLDDLSTGELRLPFSPVRKVIVRVFDVAGAPTIASAQTYTLTAVGGDTRLKFTGPPPQPGKLTGGVEVDVEAGFSANAQGVPEPLRQAMRLLVARWYENRGDVEADADISRTPAAVAALVAPYRRVRLS